MSLSSVYESGEQRQNRGHFRNLVLIARADAQLTDKEKQLLSRIGRSIGLTAEQIADVIKNPKGYPISMPLEKSERLEQLVNLIQMAQSDGSIHDTEMGVIERVALELGFKSIDDVDIESILAMVVRGEDTDVIVDSL
jgi:uncharacterized tellurite resistance protein B-like protein